MRGAGLADACRAGESLPARAPDGIGLPHAFLACIAAIGHFAWFWKTAGDSFPLIK